MYVQIVYGFLPEINVFVFVGTLRLTRSSTQGVHAGEHTDLMDPVPGDHPQGSHMDRSL